MSHSKIPARFQIGVEVIVKKDPSGLLGKRGIVVGLQGKYVEVGHFEGYSTRMARLFLPRELEIVR